MRLSLPLLAAASLTLGALPARAHAPQRGVVEAFVWNTGPVALRTGLVLGAGADARRSAGASGFFVGVRAALGHTSESTSEWEIRHVHGLAAATAGLERRFGVGRVRAQLGLGTLVLRQLAQRQQYERLSAAALPDLRRDSWAAGPWVSAELAVGLTFHDAWMATLQLGPAWTMQQVAGEARTRWLLESAVGVGRAF